MLSREYYQHQPERQAQNEKNGSCIEVWIGSRIVPVHSVAKPQPDRAKRLECVQLAGAVVKREQAPRTPNASRGSLSLAILEAREPPRLVQREEIGRASC